MSLNKEELDYDKLDVTINMTASDAVKLLDAIGGVSASCVPSNFQVLYDLYNVVCAAFEQEGLDHGQRSSFD